MDKSYNRKNPDGTRSSYYPESAKRYQSKVKQYNVQFSLSDDDKSVVAFLENEREELGLSSSAYIKKILREYVNSKYNQ